MSNDRQCRLLVSVFKFTNIGSNSRVWMPGGSEDKDGGQGRCRYQWYTNTIHSLYLLTATIHPQYGVLTPFLHCGDTKVQDHVRSLQGLSHGERNSQALDKVNVNLDRKNVSRYYWLLCLPTAQWYSWLVMFEWFLSQLKTRPLKEELEICLHCWNVLH